MIKVMEFERGHVSLHAWPTGRRPSAGPCVTWPCRWTRPRSRWSREAHVVVPKEDTVFAVGDEVLVVTSEGGEGQVRELLVGEDQEEEGEEPEPAERGACSRS